MRSKKSIQFWWNSFEGGLLLIVAPFLIFPTLFPTVTIVCLLLLIIDWLLPLTIGRKPMIPQTPINLIFVVFGLMVGIGILITSTPELTLSKAMGLILGLAVWRYLVRAITNYRHLYFFTILLVPLWFGFVLMGTLSANWYVKVPLLSSIIDQLSSRLIILPGSGELGTHTNQLAGTVLLLLPVLISLLLGWQRVKKNTVVIMGGILVVTLISTVILVLTQSRSGWLGFSASVFFLLLMWGLSLMPSPRRTFIWMLMVLLVGVVTLGLIRSGPERFQSFLEEPAQETIFGQFNTLGFRQEVWGWAFVGIQDFPFSGMGLGSFRKVGRLLYPINVSSTYDIAHAHNIFLQTALDVGLPGLIAYTSILMLLVSLCWQVSRIDSFIRPISLGLIASVIAIHIYGLTDALALGSKTGLIFWWEVGLMTSIARIGTTNNKTDTKN